VSFTELADLHEKYQYEGFAVLAFPTKDFHQELDSNEEIRHFIQNEFPQASFPIFGESSLKDNPVYKRLQEQLPEQHVQANFYKYLVDRNGIAVALYPKKRDPVTLEADIEALFKKQRLPPSET
jgi:glutathione peroxidase